MFLGTVGAMAETMTMNRVIHNAVRRDLGRLDVALGAVRDGDTRRAGDLRRAFANLHRELKHHHEGEDANIFPMLAGAGVDRQLLDAMESEHEAMAEALADAARAMDTSAASATAADAAAAREHVGRLREVVDRHLDHEESDLEPLMMAQVGTPEWDAVEKKLRSRPIGEAGQFFAWLQDGMDEPSRVYLRSTIPGPVTTVLSKVFGRRYHREVAPVWRA